VYEPGEVFPPDAYVYLVDPRRQQIVLATTGNNPGNKLSATARNSAQLNPLYTAESARVRLDLSGWGPGGRRFKSCLPDKAKALHPQGFRRA
jgi:hypothetical protein